MKKAIENKGPFTRPPSFKRPFIRRHVKKFRYYTARIRLLPDFLIIGGQKCGTTSLYNYLAQHPCVAPAWRKEVRFFNVQYVGKSITWYRAQFPSSLYKFCIKITQGQDVITGEATPGYISHPHAPKRIFETIPKVKLIVLLRNPVDRAYSHYQHAVLLGKETLSFEEAIEAEPERLRGEKEKMIEDESYNSFYYGNCSYLSRGIYVDQLKVWLNLFPKEQILILNSENFSSDPPTTFRRVLEFLNLPDWECKEYERFNTLSYSKMHPTTREKLVDYFAPHNQRLYELIGQQYQWA